MVNIKMAKTLTKLALVNIHLRRGQTGMITMHYFSRKNRPFVYRRRVTHTNRCRVILVKMAKLELDTHSIASFHRAHRLYTEIQPCTLLYVHLPLIL